MNTHVNVGWSKEFALKKALLVYGESDHNFYPPRHPFVTVHDVVHEEGEVRLAPAQLMNVEMLRTLNAQLGQSLPIEILPEQVLVRTADVLAWWSPATVRRMFFVDRGGDKGLRRLNGKPYPHPPLVFMASENQLSIRALTRNERPLPNTKLCVAPYWNSYDNGAVCTGTMRIPAKQGLPAMAQWEDSFFNSAFSHAAGMTKHTSYPQGLLALWKVLQGKDRFPAKYLFPLKQTLEQFVTCDDSGYRNQRQAH